MAKYNWILGCPAQTDNVNFEWLLGLPFILFEPTVVPPVVSPNLTNRKNYNGYLAFVQQYIKHRLNDSTPWAHPDGYLVS